MMTNSLIILSFVAISQALPQFNQAFPNHQQQGFPNLIGNQNPFLPGNQGFGIIENSQIGQPSNFGNQQEGFGQQQQRPGFGGQQQQQQPNFGFGNQQQGFGGQQPNIGNQQGFGGQQQQQQQPGTGGQQGSNNSNQQQTTSGATSSIVGTPQFVLCNQNCPSVNQYNPICGSDQITYNNQYRLDCANACGRQLDPNWQEITIFSRRNCVSGSRVA